MILFPLLHNRHNRDCRVSPGSSHIDNAKCLATRSGFHRKKHMILIRLPGAGVLRISNVICILQKL